MGLSYKQEGYCLGIKQVKVNVSELTVGMFVSGLDRPWTQTPFPLQGFYIRDLEEIRELKVHCEFVYIDVVKGVSPVRRTLKTLTKERMSRLKSDRDTKKRPAYVDVAPIKVRRDVYTEVQPAKKEIGKAKELHMRVYQAIGDVMEQVDSDHQHVPIGETKRLASEMVDSVIRSPDAFTWLTRVREKDEYTYSHAMRSAVWAILFGRHIGLPKAELDVLAMGALLKDIGKTRLPIALLTKEDRTEEEQRAYEKFIDYGVDILRSLPDVKPRVTSVVKTHCERIDGSGFPTGAQGDKIPLLGKIAGIVTFYDETTHPRGRSQPLAPSKAVARLYDMRGREFQEQLVVEFIRAIGLYPTGTLVELSSGEIAVVVEQNFEWRLKPKVMVVINEYREALYEPQFLDMAEDDKKKQALIDAGKATPAELDRVEIVRDLEPDAYDVDIAAIRDQYLYGQHESKIRSLLNFTKSKLPGFSR